MLGYDEGSRQNANTEPGAIPLSAGAWVVWPSGLFLCVLQVLVQIANGSLREFFFISDLLYIPTLFEDVARWSGGIADWRSPPSPYYFPDIPLYAVARSLGLSVEWAQYSSGLALLLLCLWAARRVIVNAAPELKEASACIAALAALGIGLLEGHTVNWFAQLTVLSVHGGAVVGTFGALALCFASWSVPWRLYVALAALAFAIGASDALYAASFGVPVLGLAVVESVRNRRAKREQHGDAGAAASRFWCAGTAALLGVSVASFIHTDTTARYVQPRAAHWARSMQQLASDLIGPARAPLLLLIATLSVACFVIVRRPEKAPRALQTLALWHILATLSTLAAMVLGGRYSDIGRMRYLIVPLASSGVIVAFLVAHLFALALRASDWVRPLLALSLVAVLSGALWWNARVLRQGSYAADMRQQIACVEAAGGAQKDSVVLAGYWIAKPLMLLSGGAVRALQMEEGLREPRWWINSRSWYRGAHDFGVVITNELGRDEIAKTYGSPSKIQHCGALELFVYEGVARASLAQAMQAKFQRFLK